MPRQFRFAKDAGPEDWNALPRQFKAGETVSEFTGHDFGLVRDDLQSSDTETIACSDDGGITMFTIPVRMLLTENGEHPVCAYTKL